METYKIVKFFERSNRRETIKTGLTLQEAKEYCSRTDTSGAGWFCAFVKE